MDTTTQLTKQSIKDQIDQLLSNRLYSKSYKTKSNVKDEESKEIVICFWCIDLKDADAVDIYNDLLGERDKMLVNCHDSYVICSIEHGIYLSKISQTDFESIVYSCAD